MTGRVMGALVWIRKTAIAENNTEVLCGKLVTDLCKIMKLVGFSSLKHTHTRKSHFMRVKTLWWVMFSVSKDEWWGEVCEISIQHFFIGDFCHYHQGLGLNSKPSI
jgi:hypothetical protein